MTDRINRIIEFLVHSLIKNGIDYDEMRLIVMDFEESLKKYSE